MFKRSLSDCIAPLLSAILVASSAVADEYSSGAMNRDSNNIAMTNDLSYSYGELRYVDTETDVNDAEADGFMLGGSYRLDERVFVFGSYTDLDVDIGPFDGDASQIKLGGGYIHPLNGTVDINATAALVREDIDISGGDDGDEIGFQLTGGARTKLTNELEVRGAFVFYDVDDRDAYLEVAADYYLTDNLVAGISIEFAGDSDVLTFGGRYYFGR